VSTGAPNYSKSNVPTRPPSSHWGVPVPRRFCVFPESDLHATEIISPFLGPPISWQTTRAEEWGLTMACVDFDNHRDHGFDVVVEDSKPNENTGNALNRAAKAYRHAARVGYSTPEDGGIWLLMLIPVEAIVGDDDSLPWHYFGHVAGFIILYDRDEDGVYEAAGHAWTATHWRRRGIARRLLEEARSRFHAVTVEGPLTPDGAALVKAVQWPEAAPP
jgi:ribosomal protein S18 acetylase RimI-like enzyme